MKEGDEATSLFLYKTSVEWTVLLHTTKTTNKKKPHFLTWDYIFFVTYKWTR